MTIENLTNPDQPPVDGDFIRITYSNGSIEERHYYAPPIVQPPEP